MPGELSLSTRSTSTTLCSQSIISKQPAFHLRAAYFTSVWFYKGAIRLALGARRLFCRRPKSLLRPEIRIYDVRPDLKNRIFRPENAGLELLPLYLDIHGGGWAIGDPETDDELCSFMAQTFRIMVVSIDYHKAPRYKFPCAVDDIAAIAKAIINDQSLNIDPKNVALGGFSAGGNLAFAAAQSENLRGQISALVGVYPVLDFTESLEEKLGRRPKEAPTDILKSSANFLSWAYLPEGIDLRNPLVSARFADPKDMPSYVYLVGAEYDMLCTEANQMAESLARYSAAGCERKISEDLIDVDGWQQGGIRWECARGKEHAFTHITKWRKVNEMRRVKYCEDMYCRIGGWLKDDVWVKSNMP